MRSKTRAGSNQARAGVIAVALVFFTCCAEGRRSCQSDIVSPTVVATFCGHVDSRSQMLDLLILWRGQPGWFYRSPGGRGSGGSADFGGLSKGRVSQYSSYGDVVIGFDADFDAAVVTIEHTPARFERINTIIVDAPSSPSVSYSE